MARATVNKSDRQWYRHWVFRYAVAIIMYGIVLGLGQLNSTYNIKLNLTIPIVFALVATVWYGGIGPGLLISVLFQGTTILYATPPPDSTPARLWFGYASVFLLYVFLVLVIGGLQRARHVASAQRDLLQVTLTSIGDAVIATDVEGNIRFMNPVAESLTGWARGEADGLPVTQVVSIINETTGVPVENPVEKVLATGSVVGLANHSVLVSREGRQVPIEDSAAPIRDGSRVEGVVFVFSDVSERKAAERARREREIMERIVEAQEGERLRIARDLHDHLGQRMTALRLKVEALAMKFGTNGAADMFRDVQTSAVQIDRDISFLSWELRPTELEKLGLQDALLSFVREWSKQYGIKADFEADMPPSVKLSREAETNLYRVTQEALNNILKHAAAENVSVLLQARRDDIVLIVEDDGRGFEAHDPEAGPGGSGLTGMRERAALLGGELEIDSGTGRGTSLIVRIPLSKPVRAATA